jgi:hypothetical protein
MVFEFVGDDVNFPEGRFGEEWGRQMEEEEE